MHYLKGLTCFKEVKDKLNLSIHCNVNELKNNKEFKLSSLFVYSLEEFIEFLDISDSIIIDSNFYLRYYGSNFNKTVQEFINLCSIYNIFTIEVSMDFFRTLDRLDIDLSNFSFILRDTSNNIPRVKFKCNLIIADFKVNKSNIFNITNAFDFKQVLVLASTYELSDQNITNLGCSISNKVVTFNTYNYEKINTSFYDIKNNKYLNVLDFLDVIFNK